jgi:hypothetical protein
MIGSQLVLINSLRAVRGWFVPVLANSRTRSTCGSSRASTVQTCSAIRKQWSFAQLALHAFLPRFFDEGISIFGGSDFCSAI